jgi:hypothetical protein
MFSASQNTKEVGFGMPFISLTHSFKEVPTCISVYLNDWRDFVQYSRVHASQVNVIIPA